MTCEHYLCGITNGTDTGKSYSVLNPLYLLLRFIVIFIKKISKDIFQLNVTATSFLYFCVCHSHDILVAAYCQKLR